ncbi:MAG: Fe-S-containing hydro-lyase [Armatimonadota bacterium]
MKIKLPLTDEIVKQLRPGMKVSLYGEIYVARDSAHKRIVEALDKGEIPPLEVKGATIYYMGPSPAKPGAVIGACGPTTSGRMDQYTPKLLELGLKGMIGKGLRSKQVKDSIVKNKAVYFSAIGGAGSFYADKVKKAEVVAYEDLGAEALRKLEVEDFPVVVVNDMYGGDLYEDGVRKYSKD